MLFNILLFYIEQILHFVQDDKRAIKKPHKNAERTLKHKTLIFQRQPQGQSGVNILAFFQVVASGQISPHFRLQRYAKNIYPQGV